MNTLNINEIVKGIRCGTFVVLAHRNIGGEQGVQVKEVHPITHEPAKGEIWLPLTSIVRQS